MSEPKHPRPSARARGEAATPKKSTPRSSPARARATKATKATTASADTRETRHTKAQAVGVRRERYLIAPLPAGLIPHGVSPLGFAVAPPPPINPTEFLQRLEADPEVTVARVLPRSAEGTRLAAFAVGPVASTVDFPQIAVVEMPVDRASAFAVEPTVHIEPDRPLRYGSAATGVRVADPGLVPFGTATEVEFVVRGSDGTPVPDAEIYLMSASFPARGVTGKDGRAKLETSTTALSDVSAVYVKPAGGYWTLWLATPQLTADAPNLLTCRPLSETLPGFPGKELEGWGWRAMRFDALPPTFRGHGVKVAIIDSGAAMTHPDLVGRVKAGRDIPGQNDTGWKVDTVGHGTHCAGIIGGKDTGAGILGIVPEAELHSCKIFPGGRFSDLIEALDYCIRNEIDVVNLSLGSPEPSELVRLKVEQARQAGVACVVAAGNTADGVCFPASMTSVLAVAAIGKLGEYPADSYHATQTSGIPTAEGYFSAKFTCFGPEIDVCAPGVAIVSSVPPNQYAAEDGTSFAGPHVTALAALVLAHHADFRQQFAQRGPHRVDRLFDIIRASSRAMPFGDPGLSGAGLPDAAVALGDGTISAPIGAMASGAMASGAMASGAMAGGPMPGSPMGGGPMPGSPMGGGGMAGMGGVGFPGAPPAGPWAGYPYPQPMYYAQPAGYPPGPQYQPYQQGPGPQGLGPLGLGPQSLGPLGLGPQGLGPQWNYQVPQWPMPTPPWASAPAGYPGPQPMATGPTMTSGPAESPDPSDPMEPLRAAMWAAGLLPPPNHSRNN